MTELPPFSSPESEPHPSGGTPSNPTYELGSAPIPSEPVTAPPGYGPITTERSRVVVIAVVVTVVGLVLCGLCGVAGYLLARDSDGDKKAQPAASTAAPSPTAAGDKHTVVYEVSGDGKAIVTWLAPGGPRPDQVSLPWREEVTVDRGSFLATVFALQFEGGTIGCRVLVDGKEVAHDSADNAVTCTHVISD
jgi:hypothetical protein